MQKKPNQPNKKMHKTVNTHLANYLSMYMIVFYSPAIKEN